MREALTKDLPRRINEAHGRAVEAARSALHHAREAGDLLLEAKAGVPHGAWGAWLAENVEFSARTAQGYMKVASRWNALPKAQRVADLSLRGALKLLAAPREDEEPVQKDHEESEELREDRERAERYLPPLSPRQALVGASGQFRAMIEPAAEEGYYFVTVFGPGESGELQWASGTIRPVRPAVVTFHLEEEHPEGRFDVERADWSVRPDPVRPTFNRWLWGSHEEYVQKHVLGHTLPKLDAAIARGLPKIEQTEAVLRTIRDEALYRDDFSTFEEYLHARWPDLAAVVDLDREEETHGQEA